MAFLLTLMPTVIETMNHQKGNAQLALHHRSLPVYYPASQSQPCTMKLFSDFCEQTMLHGFGFITKGRCIVEVVCWVLFVLTCIALTLKDTVILIQLYLSEPTAVQMTMSYDEQARRFPDATVCAQIQRCVAVTLINETSFAQVLQKFAAGNQPNILKSGNISAAKNAGIDQSIIVASYILVAEMMDFDRDLTWFAPCLTGYNSFNNTFVSANYSSAIDAMASYYSANNFDMLALTKTIASLVCYLIDLGVFYNVVDVLSTAPSSSSVIDVCENIIWFGPNPYQAVAFDLICARIDEEDLFVNPADYMTMTWSPTALMSTQMASIDSSVADQLGKKLEDLSLFFDVTDGEGVLDYRISQDTFVKTAIGSAPMVSGIPGSSPSASA